MVSLLETFKWNGRKPETEDEDAGGSEKKMSSHSSGSLIEVRFLLLKKKSFNCGVHWIGSIFIEKPETCFGKLRKKHEDLATPNIRVTYTKEEKVHECMCLFIVN